MAKVKNLTPTEARNLRARLKAEGWKREVGSGRGTSWTRHTHPRLTLVIFVEKSYMAPNSPHFTYGYDPRTNKHFEVKV